MPRKPVRINPNTVTLDDVKRMNSGEWRQYSFLKLNSHDKKLEKLDLRLWGVLVGVLTTLVLVIRGAV